jgi:hypothetical protein
MVTDGKPPFKDSASTKKSGLSESLLGKLDFSVDTKSGIANITTWITMIMYLLYLHIFLLPLKLPNEKGSYLPYLFVAFVPQAVQLILFGGDSLAHARNKQSMFFQSCFPGVYLARKYSLPLSKGNLLWFAAFDQKIMTKNRERTYKYGYTCRLIYHLYYICMFLIAASFGVILCHIAWEYFHGKVPLLGSLAMAFKATSTPLMKAIYLGHLVLLAIFLRWSNRVTITAPNGGRLSTANRLSYLFSREALQKAVDSQRVDFRVGGVWVRWEEINGRNREWLELNAPDLATLESIAKAKEFTQPKTTAHEPVVTPRA